MANLQEQGSGKVHLSFAKVWAILWPYISNRFVEQLKGLWIIILYLFVFQLWILKLPIVYSLMIVMGVLIVIIGLMFFLEGLMLGLMPFGETIGTKLPLKSSMPVILGFSFVLGIMATYAEPAISVLKEAGSNVKPEEAPLLYSILHEYANELVIAIALGVGLSVLLGVLRFLYGWSLKWYLIPLTILLAGITLYSQSNEVLQPIIGLAWDCGSGATGPVIVPLVLSLGIGVCRVVNTSKSSGEGFGIVALASLLPVLTVLLLAIYHYKSEDYYGAKFGLDHSAVLASTIDSTSSIHTDDATFSTKDLEEYKASGKINGSYTILYKSDSVYLADGKIIVQQPQIIYQKETKKSVSGEVKTWDSSLSFFNLLKDSIITAIKAIIPLCLFLFLVLRFLLREKIPQADEISIGILFSIVGLSIFGIGIYLGLTPIGSQLGGNIASAFANIRPWGLEGNYGPLFTEYGGKMVVIVFGFFLGYAATLAEPALQTLGTTIEKATVGSIKKSLLTQTVALGVGFGIALGVMKIAFNLPLAYIVVPIYILLIPLTLISSEAFVNFAWDSAGVTTGPVSVPLVLVMGLGIATNVPGVIEGFGILTMAAVMPILTVLLIGKIVSRQKLVSKK
jgi:hypothetical protein